jgi:hypothetical protein
LQYRFCDLALRVPAEQGIFYLHYGELRIFFDKNSLVKNGMVLKEVIGFCMVCNCSVTLFRQSFDFVTSLASAASINVMP